MTPQEVLDVGKEAIYVLMKTSLPLMLVALFIGLAISLFQALTQIQEMTLSFVPKIICLFIALILFMPFIGESINDFQHSITDRITKMDEQ